MFHQNDHDDLGFVQRGHRHEPCMIAQLARLFALLGGVAQCDNLRRPGLSPDAD